MRSLVVHFDKNGQTDECTRATMAAIAKHGFYLTHAATNGSPIDGVNGRDPKPPNSNAAIDGS